MISLYLLKIIFAVSVSLTAYSQPDFTKAKEIQRAENQTYTNSYIASSTIGLNPKVFTRITGTMLVIAGVKRFPVSDNAQKVNIGLQLKFPKQVSGSRNNNIILSKTNVKSHSTE